MRIYIAGKYSARTKREREDNTKHAIVHIKENEGSNGDLSNYKNTQAVLGTVRGDNP